MRESTRGRRAFAALLDISLGMALLLSMTGDPRMRWAALALGLVRTVEVVHNPTSSAGQKVRAPMGAALALFFFGHEWAMISAVMLFLMGCGLDVLSVVTLGLVRVSRERPRARGPQAGRRERGD